MTGLGVLIHLATTDSRMPDRYRAVHKPAEHRFSASHAAVVGDIVEQLSQITFGLKRFDDAQRHGRSSAAAMPAAAFGYNVGDRLLGNSSGGNVIAGVADGLVQCIPVARHKVVGMARMALIVFDGRRGGFGDLFPAHTTMLP
ncbi:MAG TPA: hypothetical protein VII56_13605 [Rhizomicrobium sp.]